MRAHFFEVISTGLPGPRGRKHPARRSPAAPHRTRGPQAQQPTAFRPAAASQQPGRRRRSRRRHYPRLRRAATRRATPTRWRPPGAACLAAGSSPARRSWASTGPPRGARGKGEPRAGCLTGAGRLAAELGAWDGCWARDGAGAAGVPAGPGHRVPGDRERR